MADKTVLGIFGPTPEELQKLRAQQDQERSMFAARVSQPYSAGYGLGSLLGGVVANIFGIEDPELKKAKTVREAYNAVLERNNGQVGDRAVFMDQLQYELSQRGQGDLAAIAGLDAEQSRYDQEKRASELENQAYLRDNRESQTNLNKTRLIKEGQPYVFAEGNRLNTLIKNNVPFQNIQALVPKLVGNLQAAGYDTTDLESAQTPEELNAAVQGMLAYGTTSTTLSKERIASARIGLKETQFKSSQETIKAKQADLNNWRTKQYELDKRRIGILEGNASFDKKLKTSKLMIDDYSNQIKVNQNHINDIDKEINRLQKSLLELQKGNVYYDNKGNLMSSSDPEVGQEQIQEFMSEIEQLNKVKADITNETNTLDGRRSAIASEFSGSQGGSTTPNPKPGSNVEMGKGKGFRVKQGANPEDLKAYRQMFANAKTADERMKINQKAFEFGLLERQ